MYCWLLPLAAMLPLTQAGQAALQLPLSRPSGSLTQEFSRALRHCDKKVGSEVRSQCFERLAVAQVLRPENADVMSYFYEGSPKEVRSRLRSASCSVKHKRGNQKKVGQNGKVVFGRRMNTSVSYWGDWIWESSGADESSCFWGNMPFSKQVLIILVARGLGVSHIVESGRMGGMSLTHYHHFGFKLVSIEVRNGVHHWVPSVR